MNQPKILPLLLAAALATPACRDDAPPPPEPAPEPPATLHRTYRAISGVSMGGIGSSWIGFSHLDQFDAVAPLGGPMDFTYFLRDLDRFQMGGFCSRAEIEALMAKAPGDPNVLNDPKASDCMKKPDAEVLYEHQQHFNAWRFTDNGGTFDRSAFGRMFQDLALAFGNPFFSNPASPFAPGHDASGTSPKSLDPDLFKHPPADVCQKPARIKNLYNAEYNADGKYDAITFCDGEESPIYFCVKTHKVVDFCQGGKVVPRADERTFAETFCGADLLDQASKTNARDLYLSEQGRFDPCREHTQFAGPLLAFDYNGNGRRDYFEPLVNNGQERFDDVGPDGCPSRLEDGKGGCVADPAASPFASGNKDPNGDDYEAFLNPAGTERDFTREDGEAFRDFGVDGVPGTGDFGEGNGRFDLTPARARILARDPFQLARKLTDDDRKRLSFYFDGGIRDVVNFGVMAREVFGAVRAHDVEQTLFVRRFADLPGDWSKDEFNGLYVDWSKAPRNVMVMYGKDNPTQAELDEGDGDHVGLISDAAQRFFTVASWLGARWPEAKDVPTGEVTLIDQRLINGKFFSKSLGADRDYGLMLPPGYDDPKNKDARYPVVYMMHGIGQRASGKGGFNGTAEFNFDLPMQDRDKPMRKMIVVFPSGRCCFKNVKTGARACTEEDASGQGYDGLADWERECNSGSFFADGVGYTGTDGIAYEQSVLDLVQFIDATYRTLPPADVPVQ